MPPRPSSRSSRYCGPQGSLEGRAGRARSDHSCAAPHSSGNGEKAPRGAGPVGDSIPPWMPEPAEGCAGSAPRGCPVPFEPELTSQAHRRPHPQPGGSCLLPRLPAPRALPPSPPFCSRRAPPRGRRGHRLLRRGPPRLDPGRDPRGAGAAGRRGAPVGASLRARPGRTAWPSGPRVSQHPHRGAGLPARTRRHRNAAPARRDRRPARHRRYRAHGLGAPPAGSAQPATRAVARIQGPVLAAIPRSARRPALPRGDDPPRPRHAHGAHLAKRLGVRPSTLMSRFARAGLPWPKSYLAAIRLLHAAHLFEDSGLSVADVAYRLEYSSPQCFGRHLRSLLGVTATEFRHRFPFPVAVERFVTLLLHPTPPSGSGFIRCSAPGYNPCRPGMTGVTSRWPVCAPRESRGLSDGTTSRTRPSMCCRHRRLLPELAHAAVWLGASRRRAALKLYRPGPRPSPARTMLVPPRPPVICRTSPSLPTHTCSHLARRVVKIEALARAAAGAGPILMDQATALFSRHVIGAVHGGAGTVGHFPVADPEIELTMISAGARGARWADWAATTRRRVSSSRMEDWRIASLARRGLLR